MATTHPTDGIDPALTEVLMQLDEQEELVTRARESLDETLKGLRLTPEEERALADELRQLRDLGQKLEENTIEIAAFGMVGRGKSSVLNALLGREVFQAGSTHGTTVAKAAQRWEQPTPDGRPTNRVGPIYQFALEAGAWKFEGPAGLLRGRGQIILDPELTPPESSD